MVTIKQLADLCGVSRGTVDRVLNNRGNVNPAKAAMIREMAEKMHYRPNPVGKALTARRKHPTVGIVMPSEGIAFFDDVVTAMQLGGDDLLAKPFDLQVLSAKVQALLRRCYDFGPSAHLLECRGAVLDAAAGTLTVGQTQLSLSRNEERILQLLMEHKGQIVSREALMIRLWESDSFIDENTLSVNITRLRRKLEAAGLTDFIRTRQGAGYQVADE